MSQSYKTIHEFQTLNVSYTDITVTNITGASTLTQLQSGNIISLNSTSGCAVTLPSPTNGVVYQFLVNNTGAHTLTAPSACINGTVTSAIANTTANLSTGTAKTVISTTSGSSVGDAFTLIGANGKYFVKGNVSQNNALQFS